MASLKKGVLCDLFSYLHKKEGYFSAENIRNLVKTRICFSTENMSQKGYFSILVTAGGSSLGNASAGG